MHRNNVECARPQNVKLLISQYLSFLFFEFCRDLPFIFYCSHMKVIPKAYTNTSGSRPCKIRIWKHISTEHRVWTRSDKSPSLPSDHVYYFSMNFFSFFLPSSADLFEKVDSAKWLKRFPIDLNNIFVFLPPLIFRATFPNDWIIYVYIRVLYPITTICHPIFNIPAPWRTLHL